MSSSTAPTSRFYHWIWVPIVAPLAIWGGQHLFSRSDKPESTAAPVAQTQPNKEEPKSPVPKQSPTTKPEIPDQKSIILDD